MRCKSGLSRLRCSLACCGFAIIFLFAGGWPAALPAQSQPDLHLGLDSMSTTPHWVEVVGLVPAGVPAAGLAALSQSQWRQIFAVYTGAKVPDSKAEHPAILGTYDTDAGRVRFVPRFPFIADLDYIAVFDLNGLTARLEAAAPPFGRNKLTLSFRLPGRSSQPRTRVVQVYPSAAALPENLLKFYLHFSHAMSRGQAYRHVHLIDATGQPVRGAFLEIEQELWDAETRRLTLFFDPGRIKRGLRPHEEMGLALTPGRAYRLVVDPAWPDAAGLPLTQGFEKHFRVVEADRRQPDHRAWQVLPPAAGGRDPLRILLSESLDHALLVRVLRVVDQRGRALAGEVRTADAETQWHFLPEQAWRPGVYQIRIPTLIEDLAGNNLRSVFDVDLDRDPSHGSEEDAVYLEFKVVGE